MGSKENTVYNSKEAPSIISFYGTNPSKIGFGVRSESRSSQGKLLKSTLANNFVKSKP